MTDALGLAKTVYEIYRDSGKAEQTRRDRLAGIYAAVSTCMQSLASTLRQGREKISSQRSAEFEIYIDELGGVLQRYGGKKLSPSSVVAEAVNVLRRLRQKDHIASSEELTQLKRAVSTSNFLEAVSAYILAVMAPEQQTPGDQKTLDECAGLLEKAAGEFAAWAALLRAC